MPARPLPDEALRLIAAVQDALAERLSASVDVQERPLFGSHAFMVNGKLCLAVKGDNLLVRLPPDQHEAIAETPGLRELDPVFAVTDSPKPPPARLTLSLGEVGRAGFRAVLALGAAKGQVARAALRGPDPAVPASLLPAGGTCWYLDDAAHAAASP